MKNTIRLVIIIWIFTHPFNHIYTQQLPKIAVFSKTEKYRHQSIEAGIKSIKELGKSNHFKVIATEDSEVLISDLNQYEAVLFLSTSGDIFNGAQQEKFKSYIEKGGGFIGIHCAAATEKKWPWFGDLLGAVFLDHPELQNATIHVVDHDHPSTSFLKNEWIRYDEWYNFIKINPKNKVLLNLDENSYEGGKHGKDHPIAWYRELDNRKMFYTALGHTEESFQDKTYLQHMLGGILYVLDKTN
jgi:type 1 glutamine amidotransferase